MSEKVTIELNIEISERWVSAFLSMIESMEALSGLGASRWVGIFADGDGDFRFKADHRTAYATANPVEPTESSLADGIFYDAG